MGKVVTILSLLMILAGCATLRPHRATYDTVIAVTEVAKDSMVTAPSDSALLKAWFECDSLNHVIMTGIETASGSRLTQDATFVDHVLTVKAKVDSQSVYLNWKEKHIKTDVTKTAIKEVPVDKIVYKKPGWLLWLAGLGAGAIVILIFLLILKFK
jgi:hypothetical protein